MTNGNTPAERESYALALRKDAHERFEEIKRKYRQTTGHDVRVASVKRRRRQVPKRPA